MRKALALFYFAVVFLMAWWPWNALLVFLGIRRLRASQVKRLLIICCVRYDAHSVPSSEASRSSSVPSGPDAMPLCGRVLDGLVALECAAGLSRHTSFAGLAS